MTPFMDVEVVKDPDGKEYIHIPDGFLVCLVPKDLAGEFADWAECEAFRVAVSEDGSAAVLQATRDLEALTAPEQS